MDKLIEIDVSGNIKIREATKAGFALAEAGDSVNVGMPASTTRRGRVGKKMSGTLTCSAEMAVICASRGRDPMDPSNRCKGAHTEQRLEINTRGVSNTLTTVQKDNLLMQPAERRIRKLTPLEYYRLMGFTDAEFVSAALLRKPSDAKNLIANMNMFGIPLTKYITALQSVKKKDSTSNTQLYKQAGNSIVVDVLVHLLASLRESYPNVIKGGVRFLSLFSGIGAPEAALHHMGVDYELVGFSEIDKFAARSYCAIHDVEPALNLGDITQIDASALDDDIDLVTYGFPCQDISNAGRKKGFVDDDGNTTRSGLFFEALRIIKTAQPKIAIAENVKALTSKRFKREFETVLESLENAGYVNHYKVLNSKDFGVPQNRERVFIVSIRADIAHSFEFPAGFELRTKLADVLETDVPEKFYLSDTMIKGFDAHAQNGFSWSLIKDSKEELAKTLTGKSDRSESTYLTETEHE